MRSLLFFASQPRQQGRQKPSLAHRAGDAILCPAF
jgi:hypothetical protein